MQRNLKDALNLRFWTWSKLLFFEQFKKSSWINKRKVTEFSWYLSSKLATSLTKTHYIILFDTIFTYYSVFIPIMHIFLPIFIYCVIYLYPGKVSWPLRLLFWSCSGASQGNWEPLSYPKFSRQVYWNSIVLFTILWHG